MWAVSHLTLDLSTQSLFRTKFYNGYKKVFGVSLGLVKLWATLVHRVLYHLKINKFHSTSIDFAKNQLSTSLISLSPLITNHPSIMQHTRVRSSKKYYLFFNLFMIRSLVFGQYSFNFFSHFFIKKI